MQRALERYADIAGYIKNVFTCNNPFVQMIVAKLMFHSPLINGVIYGLMGTGKTNILRYIVRDLQRTMGDLWEVRFVEVPEMDTIKQAVSEPIERDKRFLIVIFDDFSYVNRGAIGKLERGFLALTTKTRHLTGAEWTCLIFSVHDIHALGPFLRTSWFSIFTSMPVNLIERLRGEFRYSRHILYDFAKIRNMRPDVALLCDNMQCECKIVEGIPLVLEEFRPKVYGKSLDEYADEILMEKIEEERKIKEYREAINYLRQVLRKHYSEGLLVLKNNRLGFNVFVDGKIKFVPILTVDKAKKLDIVPFLLASQGTESIGDSGNSQYSGTHKQEERINAQGSVKIVGGMGVELHESETETNNAPDNVE